MPKPATSPLRLAVFDMDGTLIDSQLFIIEAMARGFRAAGLEPPSDAETLSIVGLSLPVAVRALAPQLTEAEAEEVAELYKQGFIALRAERGGEANAPLYPGARAALDRLRRRDEVLMGVATGKARRGLDHALKAHALTEVFHTLQTADGHPSKPHPSMLEAALGETGVDAACGVMIGDTEFDVVMGKAAGLATVAVSWGYHPVERLRAAGADLVIDRYEDLDDALATLWARAEAA